MAEQYDEYGSDGGLPGDEAGYGANQDEPGLFDDEAPIIQDGPGLFDDEAPIIQDGPGLFDEPDGVTGSAEPASPHGIDALDDGEPSPAFERPEAPLALYRRYRPDKFGEVIGQDHVTVPLMRALDNNRVNHAYLFSGPRGCGKTTSARILARCLNCVQGPTSTPCGLCRSCVDLARGGPGSIDVIEIDAASHGGVDDARDLRERAYFAPVHSRYKIYIVDEAHMVTTQGFNALLKLVEEPPPHAKFVFATTEPDKVIGTIRSRTHHYPFRLVPPRVLTEYLQQICAAEGVAVEHTALPMVVRAGGGSVRDSLSILDQLLGGASDDGVSQEQAASLLGFTPDALLDEIMDAFAAGDSAGVFRCIDKVIEVGQDPRRFAEDLLRRLRDLVILDAVPDAATNGMLEVSDDQAQRLATQVAGLGSGELTRAAEVIAVGLNQMRGTTAPRLHLELMCARMLLPGADEHERGLHARMDRLERRVGMIGDGTPGSTTTPATTAAPVAPADRNDLATASKRPPQAPPRHTDAEPPAHTTDPTPPHAAPPPAPSVGAPAPSAQQSVQLTAAEMRGAWPQVLDAVKKRRRFSYIVLSQNAQVHDFSDGTLVLGFSNPGARGSYLSSGTQDLLLDSLIEVLGIEPRIEPIVSTASGQEPADTRPRQRPAGQPPTAQPPDTQRPAGKPPASQRPDTGTPPSSNPGSTTPAPADAAMDTGHDIGDDDGELVDPGEAAVELLTRELDATLIENPGDNP